MYELGWDVMRFWVYEVRDDIGSCVNKVENWVNSDKQKYCIVEQKIFSKSALNCDQIED